GIEIDVHSKLPDVIIYDQEKDWHFLFEAFVTHGPIDEKRHQQLISIFAHIQEKLIFVTAFNSLSDFKKYADKLAFETEVWIAELPTHMIHYNGDRLLGPRN
ncbi:MAG: restriction endonuclease, partial [Methanobacteriota archaeon]